MSRTPPGQRRSHASPADALADGITERYGKLEWDALVPETHGRAALVQALALVPIETRRRLAGPESVGLMAIGEAGEA